MIESLKLQGFKSFLDKEIPLNRLTVLTGLNSSGKSSVIQALRMLDRVKRKHTYLLPGYGEYKELKNKQWGGVMRINAKDDRHEEYDLTAADTDDHQERVSANFPQLLYISAGRFGPQISITVYANDKEPDEYGQNVLKSIATHQNIIVNPCLKREGMVGNTFEMLIGQWLKVISPSMNFDYKMDPLADHSYATFNGFRAKNVGFGLSYTLPVIEMLMLGTLEEKRNSIVIIENPEAHLHAKAQTDMADLIGRCVEAGAQVIIETHSDHLFDGLRIYTKEHPGFEQKMNCYWFELDAEGNTKSTLIELNSRGRILNEDLPVGFCDQFEYNAKKLLFGR